MTTARAAGSGKREAGSSEGKAGSGKRAAKPRPAWWPKRMTEAEYQELADSNGGLCLACGELAWGDCEPDARNYPCEECDRRRVYGAEEARMMGAIEVQEAGEEPSEGLGALREDPPAAEPCRPVGTVRARGRLAHRFHGTYSAAIALEFESLSEARTGLAVLGAPWKLAPRDARFLVCSVDSAGLDAVKQRLGGYGADVAAIDSVRHSVDYGDPFTVDVPTEVEL